QPARRASTPAGARPRGSFGFVLDHRLLANLFEVLLRFDLEPLGEDLLARLLLGRSVGAALALVAQREHLQSLVRRLGRRQVSELHRTEQLTELLRKVGGRARDRLAHRDVAHAARHREPLRARYETVAQLRGFLEFRFQEALAAAARRQY